MTKKSRVKTLARQLQAEQDLAYCTALRRAQAALASSAGQEGGHVCRDGLSLSGRKGTRMICASCASPEELERVSVVDRAARDARILPERAGNSGPWQGLDWPNDSLKSREALVDWAVPLGLRLSKSDQKCLHWLQGKRCDGRTGRPCDLALPVTKKLSMWTKGSGDDPAVIVSHPVVTYKDQEARLAEINSLPEFRVEIDEQIGWCGPGTIFIAIWRVER